MSTIKDYTEMTLEALLEEEKRIKKRKTIASTLMGVLVGVTAYGILKNGFGLIYILIPAFLIYGIYKNAQKLEHDLEQVKAEIHTRNSAS